MDAAASGEQRRPEDDVLGVHEVDRLAPQVGDPLLDGGGWRALGQREPLLDLERRAHQVDREANRCPGGARLFARDLPWEGVGLAWWAEGGAPVGPRPGAPGR